MHPRREQRFLFQDMRKSIFDLLECKGKQPVSMLTAYDYHTACTIDEAGIDMILVGDSLGNVMLGYENTLAVTVDDMIHHGKAVVRGAKQAFVVIDMPFMSYQISVEDAVRNAGRIMKETNCQAVKLEGGVEYADRIKAIVEAGIPVVAHIGLTPQSVNAMGGYKVQGKSLEQAQKLIKDAQAVEEAGAFAITLECVPAALAKLITLQTKALTIGIGAGNGCDGQVLVYQDMLGYNDGFIPKFVKKYADLHSVMLEAFKQYKQECEQRSFPAAGQTYAISEEVMQALFETELDTMGFLHEGHQSLIRKSASQNDRTVVSVFVNPIQFGPNEDLEAYPRDLNRDMEKVEEAGGDLIFNPEPSEMYPGHFTSFIDTTETTELLCGAVRPVHFRGVCTVVGKLFNIVGPDRAYFGQKDAQQLATVKRFVRDLNFPLEIVPCPIVREEDGLAKSSRNTYLNAAERQAALILSKSLKKGKEAIEAGERDAQKVISIIRQNLETEPMARIDYVEVVDFENIQRTARIEGEVLVAIAVYIGKTRLIDNFIVNI